MYWFWLSEFCNHVIDCMSIFSCLTFFSHCYVSCFRIVSLITLCLMICFIILHVCFSVFLLQFNNQFMCIRCLKFHFVRCFNQFVWLNQFIWFVFTIFLSVSFSSCQCFFLVSAYSCLIIIMLFAFFVRARLNWSDWLLSLLISLLSLFKTHTTKYHQKLLLMKNVCAWIIF